MNPVTAPSRSAWPFIPPSSHTVRLEEGRVLEAPSRAATVARRSTGAWRGLSVSSCCTLPVGENARHAKRDRDERTKDERDPRESRGLTCPNYSALHEYSEALLVELFKQFCLDGRPACVGRGKVDGKRRMRSGSLAASRGKRWSSSGAEAHEGARSARAEGGTRAAAPTRASRALKCGHVSTPDPLYEPRSRGQTPRGCQQAACGRHVRCGRCGPRSCWSSW